MSTFKIFCVTNRRLCREDFLSRIKKIAAVRPSAIILREKDLSPEEYSQLALSVTKICAAYDVPCILHQNFEVAMKLGVKKIHLPLPVLREMSAADKKFFDVIGASCHSLEELQETQNLGCTYAMAGHIFATDCKKNLEPRGINFLIKLRDAAKVPLYAIGGINAENISQVQSV
ncbi:MAG: thiamine phosphate synthase, partial [Selenomonadaceae bacterium]|nr:thiamine phosphate synthase [Selenomonadaceae bacterium]